MIRTTSRFADDGFDCVEYGATARDDVQAVEAARQALEPWLAPLPANDAIPMLAELSVVTKRRAGDDASDELTLRVYAVRLSAYPRDAVESVLRNWTGIFWPAWAELQEQLDRKVAPRNAFAKALGL